MELERKWQTELEFSLCYHELSLNIFWWLRHLPNIYYISCLTLLSLVQLNMDLPNSVIMGFLTTSDKITVSVMLRVSLKITVFFFGSLPNIILKPRTVNLMSQGFTVFWLFCAYLVSLWHHAQERVKFHLLSLLSHCFNLCFPPSLLRLKPCVGADQDSMVYCTVMCYKHQCSVATGIQLSLISIPVYEF